MSPAFTNRFKWYPSLPGNRQIGRSLHFLIMCAFVLFLVGHVAMVVLSGFAGNMNHVVVGASGTTMLGLYLGIAGIGIVVAINALANWLAWKHPRAVQHVAKAVVTPVMGYVLDRPEPQAEFRREDISPFFWANGTLPSCEAWTALRTYAGEVSLPVRCRVVSSKVLPNLVATRTSGCPARAWPSSRSLWPAP